VTMFCTVVFLTHTLGDRQAADPPLAGENQFCSLWPVLVGVAPLCAPPLIPPVPSRGHNSEARWGEGFRP
jgi:hypothetical protein